jgi:hypothetical protein
MLRSPHDDVTTLSDPNQSILNPHCAPAGLTLRNQLQYWVPVPPPLRYSDNESNI